MCKVLEDMRNEVMVLTYVEACNEFGMQDDSEIIRRLLVKYPFLTEEEAMTYLRRYEEDYSNEVGTNC